MPPQTPFPSNRQRRVHGSVAPIRPSTVLRAPEKSLTACFVLLDDHQATLQQPSSRLYTGYARTHVCTDPDSLEQMWTQVRDDLVSGLHAVVLADYEWGAKLQGAGTAALAPQDQSALRIMLFTTMQRLSHEQVSQWLAHQDANADGAGAAGVAHLQPSVSHDEFDAAVARIHTLIEAGESYQVNYTYHLHGQQYGSPVSLYRRLRTRQAVPFGALMALPEGEGFGAVRWVLSCSPELFVRHQAGQLLARPMKGTAARDPAPDLDRKNAQWLRTDPKNRAENVMIVDLLRNDLGRIAVLGSVRTPALFSVESLQTAHQMTSTVSAALAPEVDFPGVLRALFPCGSITGAPKLHTMDWIARLEHAPRGLYTGAIGWLESPAQPTTCPDFCLSVAIRTLVLGPAHQGLRPARLGLGSGIVHDSVASAEYAETRLKARFLTELDPGFTLFETLRIASGQPVRLDLHLARLQASAQALGFRLQMQELRAMLRSYTRTLAPPGPYRLRIDLAQDGTVHLAHSALQALPAGPVKLMVSRHALPEHETALLGYKTSLRTSYDRAITNANAFGAFDCIFANADGALTEGGRSNLLVKLDGRWWTPPTTCGLLPGVMRAQLLNRRRCIGERVLYLPDLQRAQALAVCNSLRGVLRAQLHEVAHLPPN